MASGAASAARCRQHRAADAAPLAWSAYLHGRHFSKIFRNSPPHGPAWHPQASATGPQAGGHAVGSHGLQTGAGHGSFTSSHRGFRTHTWYSFFTGTLLHTGVGTHSVTQYGTFLHTWYGTVTHVVTGIVFVTTSDFIVWTVVGTFLTPHS